MGWSRPPTRSGWRMRTATSSNPTTGSSGGPGLARAGQSGVSGPAELHPAPPGDRHEAQPDPHGRWAEEQAALRPLPATQAGVVPRGAGTGQPLQHDPGAAQHLLGAGLLIGTTVLVRIRSETLEVYRGTAHLLTMPGCSGMVSTASTTATSSGRWCANRAPLPSTAIATTCTRRCASVMPTMRCAPADPRAPIESTCGCSTWPRALRGRGHPRAAAGPAAGADLRRGARSGARARHRPPAGRWDRWCSTWRVRPAAGHHPWLRRQRSTCAACCAACT